LNSTRKALIAAAVAVVFAAGLIFWQVKARKVGPVELSADDMTMLAEDTPPQVRARLATDDKARKDFALDMRRLLSVAEDAQAHGVDKAPDVKRQLDFQRAQMLSQFYAEEQGENASNITDQEVDDYFNQPVNKYKFDQLLADAKSQDPTMGEMPEDRLKMIKQRVGRIYIAEKRAVDQGIDKKPNVRLQLLLQHARFLVQKYAMDNLQAKIKASDEEIKHYMESHPEADTSQQYRTKAAEIVKRARAGEDFAKLAQEFGTDGTKDSGGDLGWMAEDRLDSTFVQAAKALKPGEISDVVETSFGFHIIKLEGLKTETVEGKPTPMIHARHILIRDVSNMGRQPQSPKEKARQAIEKEKGEKLLEEIVNRSHVKVADNYSVKPPEQQPMQQLPPGLELPPPSGEKPQAQPKQSPAKPAPAKPAPKSQAKPGQK
jgi:parvulin-like peptidyl-prolyl isomerase